MIITKQITGLIATGFLTFIVGCSSLNPTAPVSSENEAGNQKVARNMQYVGNLILVTETDASNKIYIRSGLVERSGYINWQNRYNTGLIGLKPKIAIDDNSSTVRAVLAYTNVNNGNLVLNYVRYYFWDWYISVLSSYTISGDYRNKNYEIDMTKTDQFAVLHEDANWGSPVLKVFTVNTANNQISFSASCQLGYNNSKVRSLSLCGSSNFVALISVSEGNCAAYNGTISGTNGNYSVTCANSNNPVWFNDCNHALMSFKRYKGIITYTDNTGKRKYRVGTLGTDLSLSFASVQPFNSYYDLVPSTDNEISFYLDDSADLISIAYVDINNMSTIYNAKFDGTSILFDGAFITNVNQNGSMKNMYF